MLKRRSIRRSLVSNRRRTTRPLMPEPLPLEARLVLSTTPEVTLLSATTHDAQSLSITYQVQGTAPFEITAFRSPNASYDGLTDPKDVIIDTATVDPGANPSSDTLGLGTPLAIDPSRPYVWVVASPTGPGGTSSPYSETEFHIFTMGVVTHGFEYTAADANWVDTMAQSLKSDGYNAVIPFKWTAFSSLPIKGMTVLAGELMAHDILVTAAQQLAPQMTPNDVVALHMIGHSRGSAVISQASLDLQNFVGTHPAWSPLLAGPWKMTFLDPHPAHNIPGKTFYDAAPTPLGKLATGIYTAFQALAQDPSVVVPSGVDWAEVYYQHTPVSQAADATEQTFISWGEIPVYPQSTSTTVEYADLTGTVFGHYAVHDWYQQNVVPLLSGNPGFVTPPGTGPQTIASPGASSAVARGDSSALLAGAAGQPARVKLGVRALGIELRLTALFKRLGTMKTPRAPALGGSHRS